MKNLAQALMGRTYAANHIFTLEALPFRVVSLDRSPRHVWIKAVGLRMRSKIPKPAKAGSKVSSRELKAPCSMYNSG